MYDAATKAWTRRRDLPVVFTHATPARVGDALWFAGGFLGDSPGPATGKVWHYDWCADTWSPGPPLPALRGGGALVSVGAKLHYFGGFTEDRNTNSADHWVLDLSDTLHAARWIRAAPLPLPRGHLSGAVVDGKIYALGGCDGHDPYPIDLAAVHRYDPATDTWTQVASLPFPRSHFEPGTLVRNGRFIIVGGRNRVGGLESLDDVTEYDPVSDRWTALPPLPEPRHSPIAFLAVGRIMAGLGGRWASNPDNRTMWAEPSDSFWKPGPPLPVFLGEVTAGVIGNRIYLLGEEARWTLGLDIGSGRWDEVGRHAARLGTGHHHPAEVWNNRLYLLGGLDRGQGTVQIYDPVTDTWVASGEGPGTPAPLPVARGGTGKAVYVGGECWVFGGETLDGPGATKNKVYSRVDVYNPALNQWRAGPPLPTPRHGIFPVVVGRRIYLLGGGTRAGASASMAAEILDLTPSQPVRAP